MTTAPTTTRLAADKTRYALLKRHETATVEYAYVQRLFDGAGASPFPWMHIAPFLVTEMDRLSDELTAISRKLHGTRCWICGTDEDVRWSYNQARCSACRLAVGDERTD